MTMKHEKCPWYSKKFENEKSFSLSACMAMEAILLVAEH